MCHFYKVSVITAVLLSVVSCVSLPQLEKEAPAEATLFDLVETNDVAQVKSLFSTKEDTGQRNAKGQTALHIAAIKDKVEMTQMLCACGFDMEALDADGLTPFAAAIEAGSYNSASILAKNGADIFAPIPASADEAASAAGNPSANSFAVILSRDENILGLFINSVTIRKRATNGNTVLHEAVIAGNEKAVAAILECGADPDAKNSAGFTPLILAYKNYNSVVSARIAAQLLQKGAAPQRKKFDYFENAVMKSNPSMRLEDGQTPLHCASMNGHAGFVQYFLDRGASCQAKDSSSSTPLHEAIRNGFLGISRVLLEAGADANAKDSSGNTPMHLVMPSASRLYGVQLLLSYGAHCDAKDSYGDTPLHIAVSIGMDTAIIEEMLKHGADVNGRNKEGLSPLAIAIDKKRIDIIPVLLRSGADIHAEDIDGKTPLLRAFDSTDTIISALLTKDRIMTSDSRGFTPLHIGVQKRCLPSYIRMMIREGADINARNKSGDTPLHIAVRINNKPAGEILLEFQADVFATNIAGESPLTISLTSTATSWMLTSSVIASSDGSGNTPLHYAAEWNLVDAVTLITSKGCSPDVANSSGETPIFKAAKKDANDAVHVLMQKGANINARDFLGNTPLHTCVRWVAINSVASLIAEGADVSARNLSGKTPLHEAARRGNKTVISYLTAGGSDINATDETGKTPLMDAVAYGRTDPAAQLIAFGASVHIKDMTGRTLFHYAIESGNKDIINLAYKAGCDPLVRDSFGNTPFSLAADISPQLALSVAGENTAIADSDGNTPVHIAVKKGAVHGVLSSLIARGFPVNSRNSDGETPILLAARDRNLEMMQELLAAGADPFIADKKSICAVSVALETDSEMTAAILRSSRILKDVTGNTILHYAAQTASKQVIQYILSQGVGRSITNVSGETASDIARRWNRPEIAEFLK